MSLTFVVLGEVFYYIEWITIGFGTEIHILLWMNTDNFAGLCQNQLQSNIQLFSFCETYHVALAYSALYISHSVF